MVVVLAQCDDRSIGKNLARGCIAISSGNSLQCMTRRDDAHVAVHRAHDHAMNVVTLLTMNASALSRVHSPFFTQVVSTVADFLVCVRRTLLGVQHGLLEGCSIGVFVSNVCIEMQGASTPQRTLFDKSFNFFNRELSKLDANEMNILFVSY